MKIKVIHPKIVTTREQISIDVGRTDVAVRCEPAVLQLYSVTLGVATTGRKRRATATQLDTLDLLRYAREPPSHRPWGSWTVETCTPDHTYIATVHAEVRDRMWACSVCSVYSCALRVRCPWSTCACAIGVRLILHVYMYPPSLSLLSMKPDMKLPARTLHL